MPKLLIKNILTFPIKILNHLSIFTVSLINIMTKLKSKRTIKSLIILKMISRFKGKSGKLSTIQIDLTKEVSPASIQISILMVQRNLNCQIWDSPDKTLKINMCSHSLTKTDSLLILHSTINRISSTSRSGKNKEETGQSPEISILRDTNTMFQLSLKKSSNTLLIVWATLNLLDILLNGCLDLRMTSSTLHILTNLS